jgi:hypothetical protein
MVILALALCILPDPLFAARVHLGDASGSTPAPAEGSDLMVSFNPTVAVQTQAGETLLSLLLRLVQGINEAGQGVYTAEATLPMLLDIRRTTGGDIDDLRFRENDPGIQSVLLSLLRPKLAAWIGMVQQSPSAGVVVLTLNDQAITVETAGKGSADAVNLALVRVIQEAGFDVAFFPPFIVVLGHSGSAEGLTSLGWRSTDPAITLSDLALLPEALLGATEEATPSSGQPSSNDPKRRLKP